MRSNGQEEDEDILDQTVVEQRNTEAMNTLTEERINRMKVDQLKRELKKLQLESEGTKQVLRDRLINQLKGDTVDEVADDDVEANDSDDSEEDGDASSVATETTKGRRDKGRPLARSIKFTIKDVDESLAYFTGDEKLPIEKWIQVFEELSTILEWGDIQKLMYGKRMLKGSAKQFVTYEKGVVSWKILKKRLVYEFKTEINSAVVHAQLAKRKRKTSESARQYVGAMQEIASQGNVEDEALIEHIINGIQDEETNKTMLYGAHSIHEMRKVLELYDRRKEKMTDNRKPHFKREIEKKKTSFDKSRRAHCPACGSAEHDFKMCPNKEKGRKCFNCNNFGHIAPNCPEEKKPKQSVAKVNCVKSDRNEFLSIVVNNVTCWALVDTWSEVSLVRRDLSVKWTK